MGRLGILPTSVKFVFLLCIEIYHVNFVVGRGPDSLPTLPVWGASKVDCSLFRNEIVLKPKFGVWPEDKGGVQFHYCCEYQPSAVSLGFELSNYTYGPDGGTLQLAPYHDLGIVDDQGFYFRHWTFWGLDTKQLFVSMLYCDVNDLHSLYMHRFGKGLLRGLECFLSICGFVVIFLFGPKYLIMREISNPYEEPRTLTSSTSNVDLERPEPDREGRENDQLGRWPRAFLTKTDKEELFSDICHFLLLSFVGSSLMEGIAHSTVGGWRSQLMYNMAVTYTYLTLFAVISVFIRHLLCPELKHTHRSGEDWRWQKVFGQLAAQLIVGGYLVLVDDVSGHGLDAVIGLVLGTCIAASVWSGGVELVVIVRFGWQIIVKPFSKNIMNRFVRQLSPRRHGQESELVSFLINDGNGSHHNVNDPHSNHLPASSRDNGDGAHTSGRD